MIPQEADQTHIEYGFPVIKIVAVCDAKEEVHINLISS